ncbi:hypothetical protein F5878DRAFT_250095 [Lentinula raphanica]|uniref:Uncharacterized protein n=1 Tax=Lentinula raphanica TaxID=153919 RepID=A0AA38UC70_9AGAR|nr:hypothetical protein F5878DRAFT_250095 [Lentinula raphanica]
MPGIVYYSTVACICLSASLSSLWQELSFWFRFPDFILVQPEICKKILDLAGILLSTMQRSDGSLSIVPVLLIGVPSRSLVPG